MSSSTSKDKDPSKTQPGLESLDYINPKLGSMYFRFQPGENLRYTTTNAFRTWKALPSTKDSTAGRPFYIFLHDYGSSSRIFNNVASKMPNFCLAVDFKGWGRSDDTKDEQNRAYSITQMKNQILPLVSLLQGEHFILVGHGMGAKVAQLYATQQPPNNFIGLVLLSPVTLSPWRPPPLIMEKYKAAYTIKGVADNRKLDSFVKNTLASSPIPDADLRNLIEDGLKDTPLAKEAGLSYGMGENIITSGLGRVKVPVILRAGLDDKVVSLELMGEEIGGKLPMCLPFIVSGCGHLLPLEDANLPAILEKFGRDAVEIKTGKTTFEILAKKVGVNPMDSQD